MNAHPEDSPIDKPSRRASSPLPSQSTGPAAGSCGSGISRRQFVQLTGMGAAALSAGLAGSAGVAGPFTADDTVDHLVPVEKKLHPQWLKMLFEKGGPTWYQGDDLNTIGMPVGGVCAGQVYLAGDGRLIFCDIFNQYVNSGYGQINYKVARPASELASRKGFYNAPDIDQGFALQVETDDGPIVRTLDREGFPGTRFCGEYPIGYVEYRDDDFPLDVRLEAFSPFIPLNADDSALPATVLEFTLTNKSTKPCSAALAGWLQNAAGYFSAEPFAGAAARVNIVARDDDDTATHLGCAVQPIETTQQTPQRDPILFADFEGDDYGDWKVEGEAFGAGPAHGTLENQQPVSGFRGKGFVNTYLGGDDKMHGKLISPTFKIDRPYISFLVGGGPHKNACMNLVVDGQAVRTATGRQEERLRPHNWNVRDLSGKEAHFEIVDAESGPWGHINIDQIEFRDWPLADDVADLKLRPDYGTMNLALLGDEPEISFAEAPEGSDPGRFFNPRQEKRPVGPELAQVSIEEPLTGALGRSLKLEPGEQAVVTFVVSWHMPNLYRGDNRVGNYYAKNFSNATRVAGYVAANYERLASQTRLWHDTYYDSTLPHWLLDRLHSTVANLATATCQWWANGRFWAWEGCGCCHGTCGHVWNYEHALARLFPRLERSTREMQDFAPGVGLVAETGEIRFRGEGRGIWAGDSQGGYVLKAYREHQMCADNEFLKRNWPNIRLAVEFLISQDANDDGILEGRQHNTYDIDYYGPNTMIGSLYLGALRAAEEMARVLDETEFADRCRKIFEAGSKKSVERLFNGEYFIQEVDLEKHPKHQYGDGCLADQLFGQGWAHQVGLGYVYPRQTVVKTLDSIWKYCWAPDVGLQNDVHKPERWFAYPGEAGLLTCTWPKSKHLGPQSTRYRDEIWTGIEYQVANHMAWEGMLTETLAMCRAVHERYHPAKHNPFNEIECGDHYARALASWGVLIGLAGFEYDGPRGHIGFAPRITPEDFRCVFTGAEGWGTIAQRREEKRQTNTIKVQFGQLRVKTLALQVPDGAEVGEAMVAVGDRKMAVDLKQEENRLTLTAEADVVVGEGETLIVSLGRA